jgi:hypothetical protein
MDITVRTNKIKVKTQKAGNLKRLAIFRKDKDIAYLGSIVFV